MHYLSKGFLEIGVIAGIVSLLAAYSPLKPEPSVPQTVVEVETYHKAPIASIHGIHLGDDKSSIESKFNATYCDPTGTYDGGCYRAYGKVGVGYDKHNKAILVNGDRLELDGILKLGPGKTDPNEVETILGQPDIKGFSGVAVCEGAYPGYHYNSLNVTTDFSMTNQADFRLVQTEHFLRLDSKSDIADLEYNIKIRRVRRARSASPRSLR